MRLTVILLVSSTIFVATGKANQNTKIVIVGLLTNDLSFNSIQIGKEEINYPYTHIATKIEDCLHVGDEVDKFKLYKRRPRKLIKKHLNPRKD
jgi:LEA14-like dessication related protein